MGKQNSIEDPTVTEDQTDGPSAPVMDGYVSPEILAAMAGEQVEFGKHVPTQAELDALNN